MSISTDEVEGAAYFRWTWQCCFADAGAADTGLTGMNANELANIASQGCNEYWLGPYKNYALPSPNIESSLSMVDGKECIVLTTDKPAYFVSVELGGKRVFSDNGFTLLPGEEKRLFVERVLSNKRIPAITNLTIQHL